MADNVDAWAMLDQIAGPETGDLSTGPGITVPGPETPNTTTPTSGGTHDAWAQLDAIAGPENANETPSAPKLTKNGFPIFDNQDDQNEYLLKMVNDPSVPTSRIRQWYSDQGATISEDTDSALQARETFMKANPGEAPRTGVDVNNPLANGTPGLADNRERSYFQGVWNGVEDVAGNVLGGANYLSDQLGMTNTLGRDARQYIEDAQAGRQYQGGTIGEMVGKGVAAAPLMALSAPIEAGGAAVGLPVAVARGLGFVGEGALTGAVTTSGDTPGEVLRDAAIGAGVNLGLGGAGDAASRRLAQGIEPTQAAQQGREVLDAASRLSRDGVAVNPTPSMTGGTLARGIDAVADAGLVSGAVLGRSKDQVIDGLVAARDRAVREILPAGEQPQTINQVAEQVLSAPGGLGRYADESQAAADTMYKAAYQAAGNVQIQTPKALARINQMITQLESRPGNVPGLDALRQLRDDLTPTPGRPANNGLLARLTGKATPGQAANPAMFSIETLRDLRTGFGDNFDSNQRVIRTLAKRIWGPLSDDIQDGLAAAGNPGAAKMFREADSFWNTRSSNLERVQGIVQNRSSEQLGSKLVAMSRTQSDELDQALSLMNPDMAARVKAAIVQDLGRANSGAQNATGDAFSPNVFARDWDAVSQANSNTFRNGQTGQDLQDIARVGQGIREGGSLRNNSGTGRVANAFQMFGKIASGTQALGTLGASGVGELGIGSLVQSTRLARAGVRLGEVRPATKTTLRSIQHSSKVQTGFDRLLSDNLNDDSN